MADHEPIEVEHDAASRPQRYNDDYKQQSASSASFSSSSPPSDHIIVSSQTPHDPHSVVGSSISIFCTRLGKRLKAHVHQYLIGGFALFALLNLIIGASGYDAETCSDLGVYCMGIGCLCALVAGGVYHHYRYRDVWIERKKPFLKSAAGRISMVVLSLFAIFLVVASCASLAQLAEDTCPYHRGVRQMALADIVIFLTSALAFSTYHFLRFHFPELRYSALSKSLGKTFLLCLCLGAVVSCAVNLITHPYSGRTLYHYGFTSRPEKCETDCTKLEAAPWTPQRFEHSRREIACFDSDGDQMPDTTPCDRTVPEQRPDSDHLALAPCPRVNCTRAPERSEEEGAPPLADNSWASHWILTGDLTRFYDLANDLSDRLDPIGTDCSRRQRTEYYHYTLTCRANEPVEDPVAHYVKTYLDYCKTAPLPSLFDGAQFIESQQASTYNADAPARRLVLDVSFPSYPSCPKKCLQLFVAAIIFASVFGIFAVLLAASLLCAWGSRQGGDSAYNSVRGTHQERIGGGEHRSVSAEQRAIVEVDGPPEVAPPSVVIVRAHESLSDVIIEHAVASPGGGNAGGEVVILPAMELPPSPPDDAPIEQQLSHVSLQLQRVGSTLALLSRHLIAALRILILHGTRGVRPYWKHLLLLLLCFLLVGLSIFSFVNLLYLVNSNCRDYIVSTITTAIVTFLLTIVTLHAVIVNKDGILQQTRRNPFEVVQLLHTDSDEETEGL
jgi:hypothetical protein